MTLPQAWMQQAQSDFRTAQRVDNSQDARTRCQAISKYQQSVEKSIKGGLDKLHAVGLIRNGSDRNHRVARYAAVLSGFPATSDNRDLLNQLRRLFTDSVVEQNDLLDSLVPAYRRPALRRGAIMSIPSRTRREIGAPHRTLTPSQSAK